MRVEWSERAIYHVEKVRQYLTSQKSLHVEDVIRRIYKKTEALELNPYLGAAVQEYSDNNLRELIEPPFRILYRVHQDSVEVVAVIHGRQNLPRTPRF